MKYYQFNIHISRNRYTYLWKLGNIKRSKECKNHLIILLSSFNHYYLKLSVHSFLLVYVHQIIFHTEQSCNLEILSAKSFIDEHS